MKMLKDIFVPLDTQTLKNSEEMMDIAGVLSLLWPLSECTQ